MECIITRQRAVRITVTNLGFSGKLLGDIQGNGHGPQGAVVETQFVQERRGRVREATHLRMKVAAPPPIVVSATGSR